ncbi:MAG: acyl-CoA dehydrogenase family protein [Candidatus Hatepunaea meridiana]|nr:acyl-CoA dehydrogenase family protein [Candidatus Hatepunaea meridiana]
MNFTFTEEHEMIRELARKFANEELRPRAAQVDEEGEVSKEVLDMMAELGMTGLPFPEEYDGGGFDETSYCILMEELARGCMSTAVVLGGHVSIGAMAIYLAGTDEQKKKWLGPMARGEKFSAFALTEPQAGSDAGALRTTAVDMGDHYLLNGQKTFITNGGISDVYSVFAVTTPGAGTRGISAFIVEADMPGFSAGKPEKKMGIRGSHTTDLFFEDVKVPKENLLGKKDRGFVVAMKTLDVGRLSVVSLCLGVSKEALDLSIKHSLEREQFGKPIGNLQAIKWMLADMSAQVYALESMAYRTAWMCDNNIPFTREAAICKLVASETVCNVVDNAVQIHGGMGYMSEYPIERMYRDARITRIFEGTNEIQRLIISGNLLKKGKY